MSTVHPTRDIRSLSDFRSNAAALLKQIQTTRRPLILTQYGRGTAVVLDAREYERLTDELALLRDVKDASAELAAGGGMDHDEARASVRRSLGLDT